MTPALKVVHVTTVHRPFDARIFHKQCISLAKAGYDVTLIQRGDRGGRRDGVAVAPLRERRSRLGRMTLGVWEAVRQIRQIRPQIVHFHDVELIWGALLLKVLGTPIVIYDVHEDVAKDLDDKAYLPVWLRWPIRQMVNFTEWLARLSFDQMSAATTAIAARFPARQVTLVRNTPIVGEMATLDAPDFVDRPMRAVYLGGLAAFNGPVAMVDAIGKVPADIGVQLLLGGIWPDAAIEAKAKSLPGWDRTEFVGWVDRADVGAIFATARCALVLYQPTPNVIDSEPNKFFECLSAGLPLIASNFPIWRALIEKFECGICVDPNNHDAIAGAITWMMEHPAEAQAMGERGRQAVLNGYNWTVDAATLTAMYRKLLADKSMAHA